MGGRVVLFLLGLIFWGIPMTWIMHDDDDMDDKRRLLEVKLQNNVFKLLEKENLYSCGVLWSQ